MFWGCAYSDRAVTATVVPLWEQGPSVWTVSKVSLAQPGGGERETKKAMGHSTHLRKKEWSKNSLRSLKDLHKHVLCHDGSPICEPSALFFSLQPVWSHSFKALHQTLWTGDTITPTKCQREWDTSTGSLSNKGCAESRTSPNTASVASSRLQL